MKPQKVLLFLFTVFALLSVFMFVFPENGISIGPKWKLQFITFNELFNSSKKSTVNIAEILEENKIEADTLNFENQNLMDSAYLDSVKIFYKPIPIHTDTVRQFIEYPNNDKSVLFPVFEQLAMLGASNNSIRILHYGDSQIETDRITSYLRFKLQAQFGGSGPGFLPAMQAYDFQSPMQTKASSEWSRFTVFPKKDTTLRHKRYGIAGSFCRFAPVRFQNDSTNKYFNQNPLTQEDSYNGTIDFLHSSFTNKNVKVIHQCKMFYGYNFRPFTVKLFSDGMLLGEETLPVSNSLSIKSWNISNAPQNKFTFEFSGKDSPEIYGFVFDGVRGISVDNISLRGCSGTIFTDMDLALLRQMYEYMNVKMLILQFGGNVVPYMTPEKVDSYKRFFSSQLRVLKKMFPNMAIIVIGLADMSTKVKDTYETYPVVESVRDALRNAAFENQCAFWDMYMAMGGKNSMPSWVFAEPALAEKDFVHFTPNGANIIAKMFYNAFIFEYNQYLKIRK